VEERIEFVNIVGLYKDNILNYKVNSREHENVNSPRRTKFYLVNINVDVCPFLPTVSS